MNIKEFISGYKNHPILFVGTGISLRYLKNSYTWDSLLKNISTELKGSPEYYFDIKSLCENNGKYSFDKVAKLLEDEFVKCLIADRAGKFKDINDQFYEFMESGRNISRFKIHIAKMLSSLEIKEEMAQEISEFKKVGKNVGSIITTNYDKFIESVFDFQPLIGNDILLSNPYGSVYKIHGCISDPAKIIITEDDYSKFELKYELIRAQLLSLFIHNPIIFLGYNIGDENIKSILKTIFTYVEPNSEDASRIRNNFLLVEHEKGSENTETCEHDIDLEGYATIRINKIKTDNFKAIYQGISDLTLPISAMDVRKVQSVVKEIYAGGKISVSITEDLDSLANSDKIIAIGSRKTISYHYQTASETVSNYFKIIDEANSQLLMLINKYKIQTSQYFPIFGFSTICDKIERSDYFKNLQREKLNGALENISACCKIGHTSIHDILNDSTISVSNKTNAILWSTLNDKLPIDELESYLRNTKFDNQTQFRKLICAYDFKKYSELKTGI